MKKTLLILTAGACLVFFALLPKNTDAQFDGLSQQNPTQITDRDIGVVLSPESPGPNQNVTITLESFSTNLNKANITWSVDDKEKLTGIGKTKFSLTSPNIGSKITVSIAIIVSEGTRVDKKIIIEPAQVDILWEASNSYVPTFYKGKAFATQESQVKVVALPVDTDMGVRPETKVYNWKKNFKADTFNSGYGKYAYTLRNSYLDLTDNVSVNVSTVEGGGSSGSLSLAYQKPKILFYEISPIYGTLYNQLLNSGFYLRKGETSIVAEPFYFSKKNGSITSTNLSYSWQVNNQSVATPEIPNVLTVRNSGVPGLAKVSLSIVNTLTLFQEKKQSLDITLGQ